jgi:hypothetical protein
VFRFRDLYVADRNRDRTHGMQRLAIGNYGRTVGIIGASRIGRRVIDLLKPFDFNIMLFDPTLDAAQCAALGARKSGSRDADARGRHRLDACTIAAIDLSSDRREQVGADERRCHADQYGARGASSTKRRCSPRFRPAASMRSST